MGAPLHSRSYLEWDRFLKEDARENPDLGIIANDDSLFADPGFVELDETTRGVRERIASYGGNDVSSGFPNSLGQLKALIQNILDESRGVTFAICIKTSCSTGDLKVVIYNPGLDSKRYHFNLREIHFAGLEVLRRFLRRHFPNISIREST